MLVVIPICASGEKYEGIHHCDNIIDFFSASKNPLVFTDVVNGITQSITNHLCILYFVITPAYAEFFMSWLPSSQP